MLRLKSSLVLKFTLYSTTAIIAIMVAVLFVQMILYKANNVEVLKSFKGSYKCQLKSKKTILERNLRSKGNAILTYMAQMGIDKFTYFDFDSLNSLSRVAEKDEEIFSAAYYNAEDELVTDDHSEKIKSSSGLIELSKDFFEEGGETKLGTAKIWLANHLLQKELSKTESEMEDELGQVEVKLSDQITKTLYSMIVIIVISIILLNLMVFLVLNKVVIKPIVKLTEASKIIAEGNFDMPIDVSSLDEIGVLALDFSKMRDAVKKIVSNLKKEVSRNLKLGKERNKVLDKVKKITAELHSTSNRVKKVNQNLVLHNMKQVDTLGNVAEIMSTIASSTSTNINNIIKVDELASQSNDYIQQGSEKMKKTSFSMTEISESSEKISYLNQSINSIAFKTNLLALNAAVEAARAGQHGKAFAVVAGEVKALATNSATKALETDDIIAETSERIEQGVTSSNETLETMHHAVESIAQVVNLLSEVSVLSHQQSDNIVLVNQFINKMNESTEKNKNDSKDSEDVVRVLNEQVEHLEQLFKS